MLSLWKLAVVAAVGAFALRRYWRSPIVRALLRPNLPASRQESTNEPPAASSGPIGDRLFLVLLVMAATTVAAVILTRMVILAPGGTPR